MINTPRTHSLGHTAISLLQEPTANVRIMGMPHPYVNTETAKRLSEELSRNDGYDIVIPRHEPVCKTARTRSETEETAYDDFAVWVLLLARKNKTCSTFTDDAGVPHSYDFTGCDGDLICMLHGHTHEALVSTVDDLTAYAASWYGNNYRCTFRLIDRLNNKVTPWGFDSTDCLKPLELSI